MQRCFFEYQNLDIQKLIDGSIYYICGDKGTGKTMLLEYIETHMQEEKESTFTEFVRFKKDVDEDQRNQIKRVSVPSQPFEEIVDSEIPSDVTINCVLASQVYLIKLIVFRLEKTKFGVFNRSDNSRDKLLILLKAMYDESDTVNHIKKILPKIKKEMLK